MSKEVRIAQRGKLEQLFRSCTAPMILLADIKPKLATLAMFQPSPYNTNLFLTLTPSDSTTYVTLQQLMVQISTIFDWTTQDMSNLAEQRTIIDAVYSCPSTQVTTAEFLAGFYRFGYFGGVLGAGYVTPRRSQVPFTTLDFFQQPALASLPQYVSWPQIKSLFADWVSYATRMQSVDTMFETLQMAVYDKLSSAEKSNVDVIQQNIVWTRPVAFLRFFKQFGKYICPYNAKDASLSNAFWSTDLGKQWEQTYLQEKAAKDAAAANSASAYVPAVITYETVYTELVATWAPQLQAANSTSVIAGDSSTTSSTATDTAMLGATVLLETLMNPGSMTTLKSNLSDLASTIETDIINLASGVETSLLNPVVATPSSTPASFRNPRNQTRQQTFTTTAESIKPTKIAITKVKKRYGHKSTAS